MDQKQVDMLKARYVQGKSLSEIAKVYGEDQATVAKTVDQPWQQTRRARPGMSLEGLFRGSINPYKA